MSNNIVSYLDLIHQRIKQNPPKALQGVKLEMPAAGQLHRLAEFDMYPEWFYLITEVNENYCEVIPGSLDGVMAGTEDIILPEDVMGDYVFLSLDMAATLPIEAVGEGFAVLDDETYNRVIDSQIEYETGQKGDGPSFAFALLGYAGEEDSRRVYHTKIAELIQHWQKELRAGTFEEKSTDDTWQNRVKEIFESSEFVPAFPVREGTLAAGGEEKDLVCECTVNGFADLITVEYEVKAKTLRIVCFTPDDEYSYLFDQWQIVDRKGEIIGTISGERAVIENMTDFDGMICLCDTSGQLHPLQNRGE
ncbi:MAG: hypothetical protein J6S54_02440 [Lentisphaeria bacterium]|nr:hypothetical protein [Lentisphaeria bacterium]